MRLLVQSNRTGRFLCPSMLDGSVTWVASLREAGGGVVFDAESVDQLIQDNCDLEDLPTVIDLDRLGTSLDY